MMAAMAEASVLPSPASISTIAPSKQQGGGGELLAGGRVEKAAVGVQLGEGLVEGGGEVDMGRMFGANPGAGCEQPVEGGLRVVF